MCSTSPTQALGDSIAFSPSGAAVSIRWENTLEFLIEKTLIQNLNLLQDYKNLFALKGYLEKPDVLLPPLCGNKRFLQAISDIPLYN